MAIQLTGLPDEITLHALSYLEPQNLRRFAQTCRKNAVLADDNAVWRAHYQHALEDTFMRLPDVRRELKIHHPAVLQGTIKSLHPAVSQGTEKLKDGFQALRQMDVGSIRSQIDSASGYGQSAENILNHPFTSVALQTGFQAVLVTEGIHGLVTGRVTAALLTSDTARLAIQTRASIIRVAGMDLPEPLRTLKKIYVGAAVGFFAYESLVFLADRQRGQANLPSDGSDVPRFVLAAIAVGLIEGCLTHIGSRYLLQGTGQRTVDAVLRLLTGSPWKSRGRQIQAQTDKVNLLLPDWVVEDAKKLGACLSLGAC